MRTIVVAAAILASGLSLAACASRPRPAGPAETAATPPPAAGPQAPPRAAPSTPPVASRSLQEEFAAAAGADRVYFDLDSAQLRADAMPVLARQAEWLRAHPQASVMIAGNCDERGTREYNIALGARRAQAVADYLAGQGVPGSRLRTISYGKERPIDPGADESAWAHNRNGHTMVG